MNSFRLNIENALSSGSCESSSLFDQESHGETLVKDTKFTTLRLLVFRVTEDSSVQKSSVNVCNHRSNVTSRVRFSVRGELDRVEVASDGFVEEERVSFVERVDFASIRDSNVRVSEDEFSDTLQWNRYGVSTSYCSILRGV